METDLTQCPECGVVAVRRRIKEVQINTTTPFSKWRDDLIEECYECGWTEIKPART